MGSMAMGAGFGSMASGTGFGTVPPQAEPVALYGQADFPDFPDFPLLGVL